MSAKLRVEVTTVLAFLYLITFTVYEAMKVRAFETAADAATSGGTVYIPAYARGDLTHIVLVAAFFAALAMTWWGPIVASLRADISGRRPSVR
jgi:hypothetical protein